VQRCRCAKKLLSRYRRGSAEVIDHIFVQVQMFCRGSVEVQLQCRGGAEQVQRSRCSSDMLSRF